MRSEFPAEWDNLCHKTLDWSMVKETGRALQNVEQPQGRRKSNPISLIAGFSHAFTTSLGPTGVTTYHPEHPLL